MTMNRKKLILIAAGWTSCSAVAFWAGAHFSRAGSGTESGKPSRGSAVSAIQQAAGAAAARTGGGGPSGSDNQGGAGSARSARAISDLSPEETAARMKAIMAIEDPLEKLEAWLEFAKGIKGDEQMAAAMGSLTENYNNRERGREFNLLMTRWAKESPEAALAWTQKHDDWRSQWGAGTVLAIYARTNPEAAIAWANAHPNKDKEEGNWHMASVISGLAKDNPESAATLAQNMDRSEARGRAMQHVLDSYFKLRGPDAARDMVMALEEGPYKNGIIGQLAERLADRDPASAAQWAATLPEGEVRPRVLTEVVDEWAEKNPNDAGTWLNGLGNGPEMDQPRERYAWKVQEQDPEAAIAWAGTITDERRRTETSLRIVREWMQREPENARAWIAGSPLSDEMKERLLNNRRRG